MLIVDAPLTVWTHEVVVSTRPATGALGVLAVEVDPSHRGGAIECDVAGVRPDERVLAGVGGQQAQGAVSVSGLVAALHLVAHGRIVLGKEFGFGHVEAVRTLTRVVARDLVPPIGKDESADLLPCGGGDHLRGRCRRRQLFAASREQGNQRDGK